MRFEEAIAVRRHWELSMTSVTCAIPFYTKSCLGICCQNNWMEKRTCAKWKFFQRKSRVPLETFLHAKSNLNIPFWVDFIWCKVAWFSGKKIPISFFKVSSALNFTYPEPIVPHRTCRNGSLGFTVLPLWNR